MCSPARHHTWNQSQSQTYVFFLNWISNLWKCEQSSRDVLNHFLHRIATVFENVIFLLNSMLKSISTLNVKFLRFQLAKLSISEETNEKEIHFTQTVCNIQLRRQILVFCRLHKHSILVSLSFSLSLGLVLYRNASISFRKERKNV